MDRYEQLKQENEELRQQIEARENARRLEDENAAMREQLAAPGLLSETEIKSLTPAKINRLDEEHPGLIERSYAALQAVK